jgi:hypothetical protein
VTQPPYGPIADLLWHGRHPRLRSGRVHDRDDLAKVASDYFELATRDEPRRTLRRAFEEQRSAGPLHQLLASVPALLVIVSTKYDVAGRKDVRSRRAGIRPD